MNDADHWIGAGEQGERADISFAIGRCSCAVQHPFNTSDIAQKTFTGKLRRSSAFVLKGIGSKHVAPIHQGATRKAGMI